MQMHPVIRRFAVLLFALVFQSTAMAQSYPGRLVKIIVPFPPGAGADTTVRLFTPKFTEQTGQQFIVDNRAGAAGNIGVEAAARAPADGYNLLVITGSLPTSISLYKDLRFDLVRDFAPIAMLATTPFVMVVHPSVPAKTVKEFIAHAKANPGKINFASTGTGGINHLAGELFKSMAGVDMVHVPYKGTSTAVPDLVAGNVSLMFSSTVASLSLARAGKLRALAVSTAERTQAAPELPTVSEAGVPGYDCASLFALFTPTGTPRDIVTQLNGMVNRTAQVPEVRDALLRQGAEPQAMTPEQLAAYVKNEIAKWAKIVALASVKLE